MDFKYKPIGVINTQFKGAGGIPIQPSRAKGVKGRVTLLNNFADGLKDLDGFSHIILLYHFHLSEDYSLHVVPFLDDEPRGLFATRAPDRPNPIGLSVVKLIRIVSNVLHIENVDIADETPLLDIKPYIRYFEDPEELKIGWLTDKIESK
jgi:tRNA-Thr(GGU) m(6)t(6)A37 methyltransferase TsaA